jgi:hypothetical protein
VFLFSLAAVAGLGAANGGYFPSEWGLATLGFVLVGVTVVLVLDVPTPSRRECAFVAGLAAFAAWAALSSLWSAGAGGPILEGERAVLYLAAAAAVIVVLRSGASAEALLGGVVAGTALLCLQALATRLLPAHVGSYDPSTGYPLPGPIGYSNALGVLVAAAALLAFGFAAHHAVALRAAGALALVILLPTLYFTYSRGAVAALAAGGVIQAVLDPRRARLIASAVLLGAPAFAGVVLARRFATSTSGGSVDAAEAAGERFALVLVALGILAMAAAVALAYCERRVRLPERAGSVLVTSAAVAVVIVTVAVGASLGRSGSTPEATVDLDGGLVSVSSSNRADYWRVAWRMVKAEPLSGMGAASWEAQWLRERPVPFHTRDAHNLYLETLAELGPVGLVLLLVTLALPFFALRVARLLPVGPAAGAALAAILLHAAVDWDWEIPVVIVAALFCAGVLLTSTREEPLSRLTGRRRGWVLACALPLLAIALVAHVGNRAARESGDAAARGDARVALEQARRAVFWAPWSEQAWELRGEAELLLQNEVAARASLRHALEMNPESWNAWLDLAAAARGRRRAHALEQVRRLNPLSPEAEEVRAGFQTKG